MTATTAPDDLGERILRLPDVKVKTGLSRSTIYQRMADETFPAAVMITEYAVGWRMSEVDRWIADLKPARVKISTR